MKSALGWKSLLILNLSGKSFFPPAYPTKDGPSRINLVSLGGKTISTLITNVYTKSHFNKVLISWSPSKTNNPRG
jgi:hypothetical protein